MEYKKIKTQIENAVRKSPSDPVPYEDMFSLCRDMEKEDFAKAHRWNQVFRKKISAAIRLSVTDGDMLAAEQFDNLLFRSLLFGAPHFFDDYLQAVEFGKPLDKKFYQPRRHYLKRYVDAYQEVLEGKLDFLSISMPKRAGKSQLGINFTNMLSGKFPDRSTLMEGTGDDLVKSFYLGCLEYMTTPSDYHFYDIFPESKLVQTNADTKIINLLHKSRFPTVMCRSIDARQVGLSEATNLLYLDDCVEGREEAKNRQRLDRSCYQREIFDGNALYDAYIKAKKGSDWKPQVQKFEMTYLLSLAKVQQDLKDETYEFLPGTRFIINERGKTRCITGEQIQDRVVKHVLCDQRSCTGKTLWINI